ncbi:MAG: YfhL family 4Fe-4S dicluster ferredoxin [Acidobacteriota bacterium]
MALYITEECINCGACEPECPNEAIHAGDPVFIIESDKCTECVGHFPESQCVAVCPVDCIKPDSNFQETKEQLLEKFKRLHPDKEPKL